MTIHKCNIIIMVLQYKLMICLIFYSLKYLNVKLENCQSTKIISFIQGNTYKEFYVIFLYFVIYHKVFGLFSIPCLRHVKNISFANTSYNDSCAYLSNNDKMGLVRLVLK